MQLNKLSITEAARGLRAKSFSSEELTCACLDAIRERDTDIHAFLSVFEQSRAAAKQADALLQKNLAGAPPLIGIPLAIKDNILVSGEHCTAGSKILEHYVASYDATVIQKLKAQNVVIIGKTNMDDSAMGSSTESSAFGPTKNPHNFARVPGGSSGGSAAAVAADLCTAALGSDTGGSIRQPASFCGIVGFKPTYGRISRHGLIAMASSLDQIGPLTKTVEDAELLFRAMSGGDNFDATCIPDAYDPYPETIPKISELRIGLPREYFSSGLDADVQEVVIAAVKNLERAGASVREISLPNSRFALPAYYIVVPSEVSANLARLDGIRYGLHEAKSTALFDRYAQSRAAGFGPEIKRRIMLGTYLLSAGYYDAYYLKAQKVRQLIRNDFEQAFRDVDVIVGPTTPTPAFAFGEHTDDPVGMYLADIYTVAVNLAGLPALSLPVGLVSRNAISLPVGLQIIGPRFQEEKLFVLGKAAEEFSQTWTTKDSRS